MKKGDIAMATNKAHIRANGYTFGVVEKDDAPSTMISMKCPSGQVVTSDSLELVDDEMRKRDKIIEELELKLGLLITILQGQGVRVITEEQATALGLEL